MSTLSTLIGYEREKPPKLVRFCPRLVGSERPLRMLTLVPDIAEWLEKAVTSEPFAKMKAQTRVHLGQFVKGAQVDDCHFMKRVEDRRRAPSDFSHGVWAISPRFSPQHRFFGVFATTNWFIVFTKQSRDWLEQHPNRWHVEIDKTLRGWGHFFGDALPHSGHQLRDYVSFNAEHCDERW